MSRTRIFRWMIRIRGRNSKILENEEKNRSWYFLCPYATARRSASFLNEMLWYLQATWPWPCFRVFAHRNWQAESGTSLASTSPAEPLNWLCAWTATAAMRCFARFALAHACHLNLLEAAHDILSKAVACVLRGVRDGGWQACSESWLKSWFSFSITVMM